MAQAFNEYNIKRTAFVNFTIPNTAATVQSGVVLPRGAIVTGIHALMASSGYTVTGASASAQLAIGTTTGSQVLCASSNMSAWSAWTTPTVVPLSSTAGQLVTTPGVINLIVSASSNSAVTAVVDFYIDYMFCQSHD